MHIFLLRCRFFYVIILLALMLPGLAMRAPAGELGSPMPGYTLDAETFTLGIKLGANEMPVSLPGPARTVANFTRQGDIARWSYPEAQISVEVQPQPGYLAVTLRSDSATDNVFHWPFVQGEEYLLPLGEGKRVPANEAVFVEYLAGQKIAALEGLSMPFWAMALSEQSGQALVCILENPYRTSLNFAPSAPLRFELGQAFPNIDPLKEKRLRFYVTKNDPVAVAKIYRNYVKEKGSFVSLAQKAQQNPLIEKLYGAPFIYLFGERVLAPEDVNWPNFRNALRSGKLEALQKRLGSAEAGREAVKIMGQLGKQDYVDQYQKNIICAALSEALQTSDFYTAEFLAVRNAEMDRLLNKGLENLNEQERVQLNMHALYANFPQLFAAVEEWNTATTTGLIQKLEAAGLDRAWIGLNGGWQQAYAKPSLVPAAVKAGYLIGPYDSYHSIHKPGAEQWSTAAFTDTSLYENATVTSQDGKKIAGFNSVGRKLNPTLSLPAVAQRLNEVKFNGVPFNSWFIDCDATGEIYDDYSPEHITTQQEDLAARLQRMAYIRDTHGMVIGSEGGNDFAASTIAFAHGIEMPSFSWMDADMKKNKDSKYYVGGWYSPSGGVPVHFSKVVPLKERFYQIFLNPIYQVPLYKLVYNDSVITSYHWDWSTFKIEGQVEKRMLREVLYNVPPMYHLDAAEWARHGQALTRHTQFWSAFSREAVQLEMTAFEWIKPDGSLQMTRYGHDAEKQLTVVANFARKAQKYDGKNIPAQSLLLISVDTTTVYTPSGA